jgi:hypothetical protein
METEALKMVFYAALSFCFGVQFALSVNAYTEGKRYHLLAHVINTFLHSIYAVALTIVVYFVSLAF